MNTNLLLWPGCPPLLVNSHTHNNRLSSTIALHVITSSCSILSVLFNKCNSDVFK